MFRFLFVTIGFVSVLGKNLRPPQSNNAVEHNENTLEIIFSKECLDVQEETAEEARDALIDAYPCLNRHNEYSETIFETGDYIVFYLDFVGNEVALNNCIDEDFEWPCLVTSEYEIVVHEAAIDYSTDTCGQLGFGNKWNLDYWDGVDDGQSAYPQFTNPDVDIYILDSGVLKEHDEFVGRTVVYLRSDLDESYRPHGTHVAGTAAGNNVGVSGDNFIIFSYPVCRSGETSCSGADILEGLQLTAQSVQSRYPRRAVINMSWGASIPNGVSSWNSYFNTISNYGGILVAAAGNSNSQTSDFCPANSDFTISVGAFDQNFERAYFSNYGDGTDIWAPGTKIYSSVPSSPWYQEWKGTSMACPHITGEVANILARDNTLNKDDVLTVLKEDARTTIIGGSGCPSTSQCIGTRGRCGGGTESVPAPEPEPEPETSAEPEPEPEPETSPAPEPEPETTPEQPDTLCSGECLSFHRKKRCSASSQSSCEGIGNFCTWIPDVSCNDCPNGGLCAGTHNRCAQQSSSSSCRSSNSCSWYVC